MTLNEYQAQALSTAVYAKTVPADQRLDYALLGLGGEAGEALNKRKKWLRGDYDGRYDDATDAVLAEIGDTLWYVAAVAWELGTTLEDLATMNLTKLRDRQVAGKLASGAGTEDR